MLFAPLAQRYDIKANYLRIIPKICRIVLYSNLRNQSPYGMFLLSLSSGITPQSAIEKLGELTYYVRKGNFGF